MATAGVVATPFLQSSARLWAFCLPADGVVFDVCIRRILNQNHALLRHYRALSQRTLVGGEHIFWPKKSVSGLGVVSNAAPDLLVLIDKPSAYAQPIYFEAAWEGIRDLLGARVREHQLRRMALYTHTMPKLDFLTHRLTRLMIDVHTHE